MSKKKKLDNKKIGALGVDYLSICLNNSDLLYPEFNKDETNPLWDGNISIYKSNILSIDNWIDRVPVQIKATTTKNIFKETQIKTIKRKELEIYYNDGGVLYFYICLDNGQHSIYYSALTQIKISDYLNNYKQKEIPVNFSLFPKDNMTLFTNIVIEFSYERKYKATEKTYSLEDVKNIQQYGFDGLATKVSTFGYKNPLDRLFDQPFYLHAINTTNKTETPIAEIIVKQAIKESHNIIRINNKHFYNSYYVINEELFKLTNDFILKMLSAYDTMIEKDNDLLSCSLKLTEWLLTKSKNMKNFLN